MTRFCSSIFLLLLLTGAHLFAQTDTNLQELKDELRQATVPSKKIDAYFNLSDYYFLTNRKASDSLAFVATSVAESSRDQKLIVRAYLQDATRYLKNGSRKEYIDKAMVKVDKALTLSKQYKDAALQIECYTLLSRAHRASGDSDKALKASSDAIALVPDVKEDSIKMIAYIGLGRTLRAKRDMLNAFKALLSAYNIAEESGKPSLLISANRNLEQFYLDIGSFEKAKDYAFRTLQMDEKAKDRSSVMQDYYNIAQIYVAAKDMEMAEFYLDKSDRLADSLQQKSFKIQVKLGYVNMYLNNGRFKEGYEILRNTPVIFEFLRSSGMQYEIDKANGYVHMMLHQYDSSFYYYKKAEPFYLTSATPYQAFQFYSQYSLLYRTLKQWDKAIEMEEKAKALIQSTGDLETLNSVVEELDSLYYYNNNYKEAYKYQVLHQQYSDSLRKLSEQKDILSLEIEDENKRTERAKVLEEEALVRRHNLQYMGITAAIAAVFIALVVLGMFKVSATVVKATGFFAFIFLFEFIILILDNQIHHLTHGEPWKVLLIKIVLIAMLLPFHHWLEEKVIHYLIENRLLLTKKLGLLKFKKTPEGEE